MWPLGVLGRLDPSFFSPLWKPLFILIHYFIPLPNTASNDWWRERKQSWLIIDSLLFWRCFFPPPPQPAKWNSFSRGCLELIKWNSFYTLYPCRHKKNLTLLVWPTSLVSEGMFVFPGWQRPQFAARRTFCMEPRAEGCWKQSRQSRFVSGAAVEVEEEEEEWEQGKNRHERRTGRKRLRYWGKVGLWGARQDGKGEEEIRDGGGWREMGWKKRRRGPSFHPSPQEISVSFQCRVEVSLPRLLVWKWEERTLKRSMVSRWVKRSSSFLK